MFLEVVLGIFKVALANRDTIFRVSLFVLGGYFFGVTTLDFCRLFLNFYQRLFCLEMMQLCRGFRLS